MAYIVLAYVGADVVTTYVRALTRGVCLRVQPMQTAENGVHTWVAGACELEVVRVPWREDEHIYRYS